MAIDLEKYRIKETTPSSGSFDLEKYRLKKEPTAVGGVIRDITRTPARLYTQGRGAMKATGQLLKGNQEGARQILEETQRGPDTKYWGRLEPVAADGFSGENVKEAIGAGLEMASYLPITRAATAPVQAGRAAFQAGRKELAKRTAQPLMQRVASSAKGFAKDVGRTAKGGAIEGGFGATAFETGREMQDEGPIDVGKILTSGIFGLGAGGVLGGLGGVGGAATSRTLNRWDEVRNIFNPQPGSIELVKDRLPQSFETAFGETSGVRRALSKIDDRFSKTQYPDKSGAELLDEVAKGVQDETGEVFDRTKLFGELFNNKYGAFIPVVDGSKANMKPAIRDIEKATKGVSRKREMLYDQYSDVSTSIERMKELAMQELRNSNVASGKYGTTLKSVITKLEDNATDPRYQNLNPKTLQEIISNAQNETKAFKNSGKPNIADQYEIIRRAAKRAMEDILPPKGFAQYQSYTDDIAQLKRIELTAKALDNQKINTPYLLGKIGSIGGILAGGTALAQGNIGVGAGSLVLAGLFAVYGERLVADAIRKSMFSPQIQGIIRAGLKQSPDMMEAVLSAFPKAEQRVFRDEILDFDINEFRQKNKEFIDELNKALRSENLPALIPGEDYTPTQGIPKSGIQDYLNQLGERRSIRELMSPVSEKQAAELRQTGKTRLQDFLGLPAAGQSSQPNRPPIPQPEAGVNRNLRDYLGQ